MRLLKKIFGNAVFGFVLLMIFNITGIQFGMQPIDITPLSASVVGLLGVPGFALTLILQTLY